MQYCRAPMGVDCQRQLATVNRIVVCKSAGKCTSAISGPTSYLRQVYFRCYTCHLDENQGCCEICASICHSGHDLSQRIVGEFYCDCGAGSGPNPCQALSSTSSTDTAKSISSTNQLSGSSTVNHTSASSTVASTANSTAFPSSSPSSSSSSSSSSSAPTD